ncbi:hypothetical protein [Ponticaulis sp.]|uniref:hypothetical protein n=1 Tax=Ponticaulis sp. TaxID=2020902 RepID=UPI00260573AD|nr:hypothetical protein [Ponticaulis sp.]MDF1682077.1 hypothetical protein [Ponticaulis sp.]
MSFAVLAAAFLISTGRPPLETALARTEPPPSLRAAFTVELTDGEAFREIRYDPRIQLPEPRWTVVEANGTSDELDRVVEEWGEEISPDGWLIPDDLEASMGGVVEADDLGRLWRIEFEHQPSSNDGPIDRWASEHLIGYTWLDPVGQNLVRVEYHSFGPFDAPGGGRVDSYTHQYILHQDPEYGVSFISAFMVDVQGEILREDISRSYRARITDIDFFFSSPVEESRFLRQRNAGNGPVIGVMVRQ